jgi:hypothetical protein
MASDIATMARHFQQLPIWLSSRSRMFTISVPGFSADMLGSVSVNHIMMSMAAYFGVLEVAAIRSQALRYASERPCPSRPVEA